MLDTFNYEKLLKSVFNLMVGFGAESFCRFFIFN